MDDDRREAIEIAVTELIASQVERETREIKRQAHRDVGRRFEHQIDEYSVMMRLTTDAIEQIVEEAEHLCRPEVILQIASRVTEVTITVVDDPDVVRQWWINPEVRAMSGLRRIKSQRA